MPTLSSSSNLRTTVFGLPVVHLLSWLSLCSLLHQSQLGYLDAAIIELDHSYLREDLGNIQREVGFFLDNGRFGRFYQPLFELCHREDLHFFIQYSVVDREVPVVPVLQATQYAEGKD